MFKRLRRWERGSIHQIRARRACLPLRTPAAHHHLGHDVPPRSPHNANIRSSNGRDPADGHGFHASGAALVGGGCALRRPARCLLHEAGSARLAAPDLVRGVAGARHAVACPHARSRADHGHRHLRGQRERIVRDQRAVSLWSLTLTAGAVHMARMVLPERLVGAMFLGLGWVAGLALPGVWIHSGAAAGALMLAGGLLYTAGAISYHRRRPDPYPSVFGYHEVFHAYVCAAATCQFIAIAVFIS